MDPWPKWTVAQSRATEHRILYFLTIERCYWRTAPLYHRSVFAKQANKQRWSPSTLQAAKSKSARNVWQKGIKFNINSSLGKANHKGWRVQERELSCLDLQKEWHSIHTLLEVKGRRIRIQYYYVPFWAGAPTIIIYIALLSNSWVSHGCWHLVKPSWVKIEDEFQWI